MKTMRKGLIAAGAVLGSVLIVTSGRAHPYKRIDFIIECAHVLACEAPELDFVFAVIGDGPMFPLPSAPSHQTPGPNPGPR